MIRRNDEQEAARKHWPMSLCPLRSCGTSDKCRWRYCKREAMFAKGAVGVWLNCGECGHEKECGITLKAISNVMRKQMAEIIIQYFIVVQIAKERTVSIQRRS